METSACPKCEMFRCDRLIRSAPEFERIAAQIDAALADGVLDQDPDEPFWNMVAPIPFEQLRREQQAGGAPPDVFSCNFRCTACRTRCNIDCEVYHGSGGHWRVLSD